MSNPDLYRALFAPRRIALIGASTDAKRLTARAQVYLRKHGYDGELYPVNPRAAEVLGEKAYASIEDVPGPIDHAYILVGTEMVEEQVARCASRGVPVATILADGFAEAGPEGVERQARVLASARAAGLRLLGPNSMGFVNVPARTACCVNAALDVDRLLPGRLSLVSHSGSLMGTLISRGQARGVGFSKLVGTGNEADLTVGEIADLLVDDAETDAILMFLETIREPDRIAAMARRAHAAGKPVIAYKLGRSKEGSELATSHTGALAGSDESVDAFLRAAGIVRVDMLETLLEIPALLIGKRPRADTARRTVSMMTTTGGGGAMVVDRLGVLGVETLAPTPAMREAVAAKGFKIGAGRLTDMTLAGTRKEPVAAVLGELLATPHTDVAVAVIGSSAQFHPQLAVAGLVEAKRTATGHAADKPLAVFLVPQADASLALLAEAGIAAFRTPEGCADAIRAFLDWRAPAEAPAPLGDVARAAALLTPHAAGTVLDEAESRAAFAALGLPQPGAAVLRDLDRFSDLPADMAYPVAAKIVSRDVPHKTEAGGVALNIPDAAALRQAAAGIVARVRAHKPAARLAGLLVQPMQKGLAEVILGFRRDPQVGPIVMVGLGGVLAEIYRDVAVRCAPVSLEDARQMIAEVKGLAPIRGYRGMPEGDVEALARCIAALSDLARLPEAAAVAEAEINPLIVKRKGEGVAAVDALILRAGGAASAHH
ncbi:MAG: acetate--CoA ligase family protein [Alphaproteobacteria bacterium]|nr:acetate--CoA ligase family protein [Alphaproteobacteria bacterium]